MTARDVYPEKISVSKPNARTLAFLATTGARVVAEIGVYEGHTTEGIARFLDGEGELHLFDFEDRVEQVTLQVQSLGFNNVIGHGNSYKLLDSYNWSLMRVLQQNEEPIFDYVFLDGAHVWAHDALAFCLVDRLLKPSGYVDFDDYRWTLATSRTLKPEVFPLTAELYTSEQIAERQVALIVDLLVRRDPRYREVVQNKIFQKLPSDRSAPIDEREHSNRHVQPANL